MWVKSSVDGLLVAILPGRDEHCHLVPQLPGLKEQQLAGVRADDHPLIRDPRLGEVVLRLHLLEGKLLEVALAVAVELEDAVAHHADLGVVLWVEGHLVINKHIVQEGLTLYVLLFKYCVMTDIGAIYA